ncbi:MAG: PAS domain S-box protein [Gemmataceae bacterium]
MVYLGYQSPTEAGFSVLKESILIVSFSVFLDWLVLREMRTVARVNALLHAVVEETTDAIFVKDHNGKYLLINTATTHFVGKSISEMMGQDDNALFDPDSARIVMERDRRIISVGRAETAEEVLTAAGVTRTYLSTKAPFRDENGKIAGLIGISRDITERKKAQDTIKEREAFARGVLDSMTAHIAVLDRTGKIVAVNESWKMFNSESLDINQNSVPRTDVGTNYLEICDNSAGLGCDEAAQAAFGIRQVIDGIAKRFVLEYACHTPGEDRWFTMSVTPLDHTSGGVVVSHTVITALKLAEEESRQSRAMLQMVLDNIPQGVFWKDQNCRFMGCNQVVAQAMGLAKSEEIIGRMHSDLPAFTPEQAEFFTAKDREVIQSGLAQCHIVETITKADGKTILLDTSKVPMRDAQGNVLGILGIWEDITERRRTEEELREQRDRFAQIASTAPGVIYSYRKRPDGTLSFPYASPVLTTLSGLKPEDVRDDATPFVQMLHPDDRDRIIESVSISANSLAPWKEIFRICREGIGDIWVEGHSTPQREADGGTIWVGFLMDITDRKRDEDVLRYQHAFLRSQSEASPDGILVVGSNNRVQSYNRRFLELWGIPEKLVAQGDDLPVLTIARSRVADPDEFSARVAAIYAYPDLQSHDEVVLTDGRTLERYSGPIRGNKGEQFGRVWFFRDITDRIRSELAVRVTEARLRLFVEHVSAPIAMLDRDMRYLHVSRRWMLDYRLGDRDLTGLSHYDVFPEVTAEWREVHRRSLAGSVERCEEDRFVRSDGSVQWIRWEIRPWIQENGEIGGIIIFSEDISERKRSFLALQESEAKFRSVFENAATGIGITDPQGRFVQCNPAYCAIFGLSEDELRSADLAELIHPDDRDENMSLIRQLAAEEIPSYELENRFLHKSGRPVWVHKNVTTLRDETGRISYLIALVSNVTERRLAVDALRDSEERYRRVVDVLPAAVFVHSIDEILFCNPAFVRLMGASREQELLGRNPFDILHPEFRQNIRERIAKMYLSGEPMIEVEKRIIRIDGKTILVDSSATPISGYGPNAVLVALTDLSERERSTALLRSVLGSVDDAIITIDLQGTIRSINPSTERLFGYPASELVGGNVRMLMPEPHRGNHDQYLNNYSRTGDAKIVGKRRELTGIRKDGTSFPIEITVTEFQFDGEQRFTGVLRDLTARRLLEAQFQQAQKMEAIGRLAGGVAHDFNNLLTIINGYSELTLNTMPAEDSHREYITSIRDAGERAARLTQQLLAFSRKAIIEPMILDLNDLVAESAKLLRRLIGEDIVLSVIPDANLGRILADPGQVEQVIMNLVVNARDAMPAGGKLIIETHDVTIGPDDSVSLNDLKPGRYSRLSVSDNGQGMTEEVKGKIFEPFFTTKGVGKGTGLGLAVVHGVIKQCGGHISVNSKVGMGTTVNLLFPVAKELAERPATDPNKFAARGNETVLLVEDEDAVRMIARLSLESQGYKVLEAGQGSDAIQLLKEWPEPIHLLVTDMIMPEMSGRQLSDIVRSHRPELPVLFMSGYTDDAVIQWGVESNIDSFIQKPFTPLGLARKVRSVLDGIV